MKKTSSHKKIDKFLEDNELTWHSIHNWVENNGYVIVTQEEYDNLEVIDPDGTCP